MIDYEDTIVAISTPPGKGGIGIIRISGAQSLPIALRIFIPKQGMEKIEAKHLYFGKVVDRNGRFLDHGYLTFFKAPESYSGENSVEIACHGSPFVLKAILEEAASAGARIAEPGEFTMRAFLNGRIDLIQAEAIRDLIDARTYYQAQVAYSQLEGELSRKLAPAKEKLIDIIAGAEASLDFPDEDEKFISRREIAESISFILLNIKCLLASFAEGKVLQEGAIVAIVGAPNVGKSSIFNQLLKYDRAIVTDMPGTTRDTVEETIDLDGIPVWLIDTAGLREARDIVEREGVKRSEHAIRRAGLVLYVIDYTKDISKAEMDFFSNIPPDRVIIVVNKIDLDKKIDEKEIPTKYPHIMNVSARNGDGIRELNRKIRTLLSSLNENSLSDGIITNIRHAELLKQASHELHSASASLKSESYEEYILLDLKKALHSLNELTGETTMEEIYDRIFSRFCLGK